MKLRTDSTHQVQLPKFSIVVMSNLFEIFLNVFLSVVEDFFSRKETYCIYWCER